MEAPVPGPPCRKNQLACPQTQRYRSAVPSMRQNACIIPGAAAFPARKAGPMIFCLQSASDCDIISKLHPTGDRLGVSGSRFWSGPRAFWKEPFRQRPPVYLRKLPETEC